MAELRQQAGRKSVVEVNLGGADHVSLRQREVDLVPAVDAVQLDLRRTGVVQGELVVELAGGNWSAVGPGLQRSGIALHLSVDVLRGAGQNRGKREDQGGAHH